MCTLKTSSATVIQADAITHENALEVSAYPKEIARAVGNLNRIAGHE